MIRSMIGLNDGEGSIGGKTPAQVAAAVTSAALGITRMALFTNPEATGTTIHAALAATASNTFPGPFVVPAYPRSIYVSFSATWNGGNVVVTGNDYFGNPVTDTFVSNPGGNSVGAGKIYAGSFGATKTIVGTLGTATILVNAKIGLPTHAHDAGAASFGIVDGATVEAPTVDTTYSGVTMTVIQPNGVHDFLIVYNSTD